MERFLPLYSFGQWKYEILTSDTHKVATVGLIYQRKDRHIPILIAKNADAFTKAKSLPGTSNECMTIRMKGAVIGSDEFKSSYVDSKIEAWIKIFWVKYVNMFALWT